MVNGGMRAARSSSNLISAQNTGPTGSIAATTSVASLIQIPAPTQSLLQPLSLQVRGSTFQNLNYCSPLALSFLILLSSYYVFIFYVIYRCLTLYLHNPLQRTLTSIVTLTHTPSHPQYLHPSASFFSPISPPSATPFSSSSPSHSRFQYALCPPAGCLFPPPCRP
jgi:hypothetical protein